MDTLFKSNTSNFIYGIIIELIDNEPYKKIEVDMWFDSLYTGSFEVPWYTDINNGCFGKTTSIFKTKFRPIKTTGTIIIKVKTYLLYNDQVSVKLLTNPHSSLPESLSIIKCMDHNSLV